MDDIAEQFAKRDRFIRHMNAQLTPKQRMEKMANLQAYSWKVLRNGPGYEHFLRRNFKARAIDVTMLDER